MNRLAVFVEGYTEILFIEKLLEEIAGVNNIIIESRRISGGSSAPRKMKIIKAAKQNTGQKYFVLIFDCGGDESVKTRILEEHGNLTKKGYSKIIGIRDVRPKFTYAEIPRLEVNLPKYIKTSFAPVAFILSIMEIEAWFLAEISHYSQIEPSITVNEIKKKLGFDPEHDNLELRPYPADDLNACYAIGGKTYTKDQAKRTVDALDYDLIYCTISLKFKYLDRLIFYIRSFLS
jgi:hypothetical protein